MAAAVLLGFGSGLVYADRPGASAGPDPIVSEGPTSPAFPQEPEPVAAVAEKVMASVVHIETRSGIGSGVVYDPEGLILTAAHVVEGQEMVRVRLLDGSLHVGQVLGGDERTDVAVVRIEASGLPAAELALDEEIRVGQLAVAIGSPFGLDSTVTSGVVSAVNQTVGRDGNFQAMIQTDAAINPGNSGGALANRNGAVIGINVSIFTLSGGNQGIGFAIPIDLAYETAVAIVAGERLERAVLGITGTGVESGQAGALVTGVSPGSGADRAGIQIGDVIVEVEGVTVRSIQDVAAQVRRHRPGDTVSIVLLRAGERIELEAVLGR